MITGRINIHLLVYIVFAVSLFFPHPVFIISLTCRICNRGKRTEHLPVDISGFCFLSLHSVTTIPVCTIGSAVCSKAYIWILCIFHFPFLIPQILLCCSVFILKKKKIDLEFSIHSMQNFESKKLLDPDV